MLSDIYNSVQNDIRVSDNFIEPKKLILIDLDEIVIKKHKKEIYHMGEMFIYQ
jgi:hypothetical protein